MSSVSAITAQLLSSVANPTISTLPPPTTSTEYYPLTTVFRQPQWCSKMRMTYFGDDGGLSSTFWKDSAFGLNNTYEASLRSCYPPHFTYQPDLFATDGYIYSPGVCPQGYYAAKSNGAFGKLGGAATSWCCPSGMTFSAFQGCVSLTTPASATTLYYNSEPLQQLGPYYVLEPYIPVAWATSDLAHFTPTSAPLSVTQACKRVTTGSPVPGGSNTGSVGPASKDTGMQSGSSVSTAAKAGIGVGVPVVAIAAAVLIVLLLKYRRKAETSAAELRRRDESDVLELKSGSAVVDAETDADSRAEADGENGLVEVDSQRERTELDSPVVKIEMDGSGLRHELDSGWYGHEK